MDYLKKVVGGQAPTPQKPVAQAEEGMPLHSQVAFTRLLNY